MTRRLCRTRTAASVKMIVDFTRKLENYAKLLVKIGANVQPGQEVVLQCPVEKADFARLVTEQAYRAGAREVVLHWRDEKSNRIRFDCAPLEVFEEGPGWRAESLNYYARRGAAFINVISEDPEIYKGVSPEKLLANTKATDKAFTEYYQRFDDGSNQWTIGAVPNCEWARKVFPGCEGWVAEEKLWSLIFRTVRIDREDPVAAWQEHCRQLADRAAWLNSRKFRSPHYTNSLGTDLVIGLPEGHIWLSGAERSRSGVLFVANLPTEEVFTMPSNVQVNGRVVSAMPLSYQGALIDRFSLTFEKGRVTSFEAAEGHAVLQRLLDTDEGSRRLGEVALVPYHSPISQEHILFYNTLFDENASCHLALGQSYPNTLEGGVDNTREELAQRGGNDSINHVDFMVGTKDLRITGVDGSGSETVVFDNGDWAV